MIVCILLIVVTMKLFPLLEEHVLARSLNMNFYLEMDRTGIMMKFVKGVELCIRDKA